MTAEQQLSDSLAERLDALASLVVCADEPLGLGPIYEALASINGVAGPLVARLAPPPQSDPDDEDADALLAVRTAESIVAALWPDWPGTTPPIEWWATPLGALVARWYGQGREGSVSAVVAAAMLGVTRARVYQLLDDGSLERHPHGGVVRASVATRLTERLSGS